MHLQRLCVFCGSRTGDRAAYVDAAHALGASLLRRGITLVYGGAAIGLMGELAGAVMAGGGEVIGVIPRDLFSNEVEHQAITTLHRVDSMHERKALMYSLADAFAALPGGLGTLEELAETLTWRQIGLHHKPLGLLDVEGYFDALRGWLDHSVAEGFTRATNVAHLVTGTDADSLLDELEARLTPPSEADAAALRRL